LIAWTFVAIKHFDILSSECARFSADDIDLDQTSKVVAASFAESVPAVDDFECKLDLNPRRSRNAKDSRLIFEVSLKIGDRERVRERERRRR
jgi:hypothetical protein